MKNDLLLILEASDSMKTLNEEFNKPFGWLRIKEKREYKKLKDQLLETIENLRTDTWDIDYLYSLEKVLIVYQKKLSEISDTVYVSSFDNLNNLLIFKPIYFQTEDKSKIYMIEIIGSNIYFNIMDDNGNHVQVIGSEKTVYIQKKVELECKTILIDLLKKYINSIDSDENKK